MENIADDFFTSDFEVKLKVNHGHIWKKLYDETSVVFASVFVKKLFRMTLP